MNEIFDLVYNFLKWLSSTTGLTYREVNILVYFFLIPSLFVYLVGRLLRSKFPILVFLSLSLISILIIPDFERFSDRLFEKSVDFLEWFEIIGLNYIQASVIICVFIPILLVGLLMCFKRKNRG